LKLATRASTLEKSGIFVRSSVMVFSSMMPATPDIEKEVIAFSLDFGAEYKTPTPYAVISRTVKKMTATLLVFRIMACRK
jgi:hypothetical protein